MALPNGSIQCSTHLLLLEPCSHHGLAVLHPILLREAAQSLARVYFWLRFMACICSSRKLCAPPTITSCGQDRSFHEPSFLIDTFPCILQPMLFAVKFMVRTHYFSSNACSWQLYVSFNLIADSLALRTPTLPLSTDHVCINMSRREAR